MNRREIIKQLSIVPIAGSLLTSESVFGNIMGNTAPFIDKPYVPGKNIYDSIGVETIINCRGTFTILGGSTERPEVIQAMESASGYFAQYDELAIGIGQRLADLTTADWGMVSAG